MSLPEDIDKLLTDQERILMAAWMLPNEGVLTDAQRKQAMANFVQYIRDHDLTVGDVAHQLGTPKRTLIDELIKGVYRKTADDHIRRLNMYIEQHARARAASLTDTFITTTKVAKAMLGVAQLAYENRTMGLVHGPTGIGKSRCALVIHERHVGSVYISIMRETRHPKGLIRELAAKLGVRKWQAGVHTHYSQTQFERVLDTLRNSARLLILDEASKLTDEALELLRDIHDNTGIPMLLVATKDLKDRIERSADPDHGQLYSRFDITWPLTEGYEHVGGTNKALHTVEDIRALYNQPPIKLSTDAVRHLQAVANELGRGSLRRCKMLIQNAAKRARKRQSLAPGESVTVTGADLEYIEANFRKESSEREAIKARRRVAQAATA